MYVCICLAVTDRQVRQAIDGGACTRKQLIECLGVGRVCGKCNHEVKALLMAASCTPAIRPCSPIHSTQEGTRP